MAGTSFLDAPWIRPVRGYLEDVKRLMTGDVYIGRGCRQRGLGASKFGNYFKLSSHSQKEAIRLYGLRLRHNKELLDGLWTLSGTRRLCHFRISQACHAIIACYSSLFPSSYDHEALPSHPGLSVKAARGASQR